VYVCVCTQLPRNNSVLDSLLVLKIEMKHIYICKYKIFHRCL